MSHGCPNPSTHGSSVNITVLFTNKANTSVSGVTLKVNVVNSSGTVVAMQSQTGVSMGPGQTNNVTIVWTPSTAGTYTVQGVVMNSSGTVLAQNNSMGTATVN